ncbi:hypothetical protein ACFL0Y_01925 [Patescibacteria group bacterium]
MKKITRLLFVLCLLISTFSYFRQEKLPPKEEVLNDLNQEPQQIRVEIPAFTTTVGEIDYTITPRFEYELYGLVVSYHHSARWWDYYHDKWQDFINLKDICVVWGENSQNEVYQEMKFSSGSWTCHYQWPSRAVGSQFNKEQLSNNHLLADDPQISQEILKSRRGDQVYFKGYLANYSHSTGFNRSSSTTRKDNGCEVIYVTDFKILKRGNQTWRLIHLSSKYLLAALLVVGLASFLIPPRKTS